MRKLNNQQRLLKLLSDGLWHSSSELAREISFRFGDTIHKLRRKGHQIEKRLVEHNHYEYRLIA